RPAVSPTRQHHLSSAGEGGSKYYQQKPQAENYILRDFFAICDLLIIFQHVNRPLPWPRKPFPD
ncbi:hypothetical protein, partial [Ruegeria lacuscaerulensis]|uniref:hypothetical protein n=1 Tax=Ruegeria lacuscaerulensis TaxID=55218 RepID=UPI001BE44E21